MNIYTKQEVVDLLKQNNIDQPKAKYSNNVILQMLHAIDENAVFSVEPTRGQFALNRGTIVEEIVKAVLGVAGGKTQKGKADIDLSGVDKAKFEIPTRARKLEVKFATTFAPATASQPSTKYVILITADGAFLIEAENHEGRYTNTSCWDGEKMEALSEMLGF